MAARVGRFTAAALVIAALLPGVAKAAPTASFVAHRGTAGGNNPAPLYVHFDATATTSSLGGDKPFMDLLYEWDFGDPASGNWATNGLPKNRAIGGVAAHVYERPGTYTVKLTVTDRTGASSTATRTVVVQDPDQFWSSTTACVSATGNCAGCPAGASTLTSGDFTAAMQNRVAAGARRILFRRGETFVSNSPWATPGNLKTEALVSAFGTGTQPVVQISGSNTRAAIILSGSSVTQATSGGWRFVDFRISSPVAGNPARGVSTSFVFDDVLLYKMDIGPTGHGFNFGPDQSGLKVPHRHYAVVDTQLRGNTPTPVTNSGSCWFGGADKTFISGVTCGQANFWQMRIAYTNKAVISNNVVRETAGAFEAIKFHCSLDPFTAIPGHVCRHMVFSDNVIAKTRINVAAGSSSDTGTIQDSIFERNLVNGCIENENPNDMMRHNVALCYSFKPRAADSNQPRGNVIESSTCDGRKDPVSCINIIGGAKVDGLIVRNVLAFAPGTSPRLLIFQGGSGAITQLNNVTTNVNPFAAANPNPLVRTDYVLKQGSSLVDAGVALTSRSVDLLGRVAPQGSGPDIGAVEFESGGGVVVDGPPAPPLLLSVDVQP